MSPFSSFGDKTKKQFRVEIKNLQFLVHFRKNTADVPPVRISPAMNTQIPSPRVLCLIVSMFYDFTVETVEPSVTFIECRSGQIDS